LRVVGDDDQALYRCRGSTVEIVVEFEDRCKKRLGFSPTAINLATNYRFRRTVVGFYGRFIRPTNWKKGHGKKGAYRMESKAMESASHD